MKPHSIAFHRLLCRGLLILAVGGISSITGTAHAGRFEGLTKRFAKGDKASPVAATFFGGADHEEFIDAGQLLDGTIVAFGNAAGPTFPASPKPVVLGKGQHLGLKPLVDSKAAAGAIAPENPDLAGIMVFYDDTLSRVLRVVKFDWGVASISLGAVSGDGKSLLVAGRCTTAFRDLAKSARSFNVEPLVVPTEPANDNPKKKRRPPAVGPYNYQGASHPGDVYVARLSLTGDKIEWVWVFEGMRVPPEKLWTDKYGSLYCDVRGMRRISADGKSAQLIHPKSSTGQARWLAVDPNDGGLYFGGDRNTSTGYQPYRQPYLYKFTQKHYLDKFDQKQEQLWTLWEPNPKECACGGDGNGLCSDSSVRGVSFLPNGDLLVQGWSDGGNSVFTRQPKSWRDPAGNSSLGMESWGMKAANSLSYLMVIDAKTHQQKAYTLWLAYIPETFADVRHRGAPNFTTISSLSGLADGSIGFAGSAATGLIQTPNALCKLPTDGKKFGGAYVAILNKELNDVLFSSYLPGCDQVSVSPTRKGVVAVSRSDGGDPKGPLGTTPVIKPIQAKHQGGSDGHILLLSLPSQPGR
jgi:hypothetical protein